MARGIAYNAMGKAEANMGIAIGDVDGDGLAERRALCAPRSLTGPAAIGMITVSVLPGGRNPRSHVPDAKTSEEASHQGENGSK